MRHWQHSSGACKLPNSDQFSGDLLHIFKSCPFLKPTVQKYLPIAKNSLQSYPFLRSLFSRNLANNTAASLQFLLDPSTDPVVTALPLSSRRWPYPSASMHQGLLSGLFTGQDSEPLGSPNTSEHCLHFYESQERKVAHTLCPGKSDWVWAQPQKVLLWLRCKCVIFTVKLRCKCVIFIVELFLTSCLGVLMA